MILFSIIVENRKGLSYGTVYQVRPCKYKSFYDIIQHMVDILKARVSLDEAEKQRVQNRFHQVVGNVGDARRLPDIATVIVYDPPTDGIFEAPDTRITTFGDGKYHIATNGFGRVKPERTPQQILNHHAAAGHRILITDRCFADRITQENMAWPVPDDSGHLKTATQPPLDIYHEGFYMTVPVKTPNWKIQLFLNLSDQNP